MAKGGGQDLYRVAYRITSVPEGCTSHVVGDTVDVMVPNPPPTTITLNEGGACNGVTAEVAGP